MNIGYAYLHCIFFYLTEALTTCGDYFPAPPFHCDVFQTEGCVSLPETTTASPVTTPGRKCG